MKKKNKNEFDIIINDIVSLDKFYNLKDELHHGIDRYHHSMRVAKGTYTITKKLHLDYEKATRAALLHDFFTSEDVKDLNTKETFLMHPMLALENARKYFAISDKQANIIASHMYPCSKIKPSSSEAWITSLVDKGVAVYEMYRYKASLVLGVYILFIINIISMELNG